MINCIGGNYYNKHGDNYFIFGIEIRPNGNVIYKTKRENSTIFQYKVQVGDKDIHWDYLSNARYCADNS